MSQNWRDWPLLSYTNLETLENLADRFEYYEDDIVICTYYKAGTTLTQELVYSLIYGAEAARSSNNWIRSPFLEYAPSYLITSKKPIDWAPTLQRPRVMKTHLPAAFHLRHLNADCGPRVLVVMRNPKDSMVSAFHHFLNYKVTADNFPDTFSEFWKILALESRGPGADYHNYFDFVLSWWLHRDNPRVRILFFEDIVRRKSEIICDIAQYLGVEVTDEKIQAIEDYTSFDSMRNNPNVNPTLKANKGVWSNDFNFIRKGQVGDWKNYFTVADNELMERAILDQLEPAGLKFVYD